MVDVITNTDGAAQSLEGAGVVTSSVETFQAAFSGDLSEFGASAAGLALDGLSTVADPFGALASAGIGWAIEHFGPLKELFDMVTGDADAIKQTVEKWSGVGEQLRTLQTQAESKLDSDLSAWTGEARKAFDGSMDAVDASILASADRATKMAEGVGGLGNLLSVIRALLRDAIAELVAWAIGALVGGAIGSVFTFGAAGAAAITALGVKIATKVAEWGPKFAKLAKLITRIAEWFRKFGDEMAQMRSLMRTGKRLPDGAGTTASSAARQADNVPGSATRATESPADAARRTVDEKLGEKRDVFVAGRDGTTQTSQRVGGEYYGAGDRRAWTEHGRQHNRDAAYRDVFNPADGKTPVQRHEEWLDGQNKGIRSVLRGSIGENADGVSTLGTGAVEQGLKGAVETGKSYTKDQYSEENIEEDKQKSFWEK